MKRRLRIAVVTAMAGAVLALMGFVIVGRGAAAAAQGPVVGGQMVVTSNVEPDTSSLNCKQLSDDVGVMIRKDDRLGLRGRLYVRVNDVWVPVATDGLADVLGSVQVR